MPILGNDEFKVLVAIIRKTYGWHKDTDSISNSQFEKMTGLSTRAVQRAKVKLKEKGLIAEHPPEQPWMAAHYEFIPPVYRFDNPSQPPAKFGTPPMPKPPAKFGTPPMPNLAPSKYYSSKEITKGPEWAWNKVPEALRVWEPTLEHQGKFGETDYFKPKHYLSKGFVEQEFKKHGFSVKVI